MNEYKDLWVLGPPSSQVDTVEELLRAGGAPCVYALEHGLRSHRWDGTGWDGHQRIWLVEIRLVGSSGWMWQKSFTTTRMTWLSSRPDQPFRDSPVACVLRHLAGEALLHPSFLTGIRPDPFSDSPAGVILSPGPGVWQVLFPPFGEPEGVVLAGNILPRIVDATAPRNQEDSA